MLSVGQEVMVVGDARCPMGAVVTVSQIGLCEMADGEMTPLYQTSPLLFVDSRVVWFQEHHLMPIAEEITVLEDMLHSFA
jgi:hypothetical protein